MARDYLAGGKDGKSSSADRYQVMVHVDERALRHQAARSDLPVESVRRLTCDRSVTEVAAEGHAARRMRAGRGPMTTGAWLCRLAPTECHPLGSSLIRPLPALILLDEGSRSPAGTPSIVCRHFTTLNRFTNRLHVLTIRQLRLLPGQMAFGV